MGRIPQAFSLAIVTLCSLVACGGSGGQPGSQSPSVATTTPSAPSGVSIKSDDGSFEVSWTAVSGATSYAVYWQETPGVTKAASNRQTVSASPATFPGENGKTYYVAVTAINGAGESPLSGEQSAWPNTPAPRAVQEPYVTSGDGELTVSWDEGDDADYWEVTYRPWNEAGSPVAVQALSSPLTVGGLSNGTPYRVTVAAINDSGTGPSSAEIIATPLAPEPGWTTQQRINNPPTGIYSAVLFNDFTIADSGESAVVWLTTYSSGSRHLHLSYTEDFVWSEPVLLGIDALLGTVAITPNGDIHVAYTVDNKYVEWIRIRNGIQDAQLRFQYDSPRYQSLFPKLASDAAGNVFMSYMETQPGSAGTSRSERASVMTRRYDAGTETWGTTTKVFDGVGLAWYSAIGASNSNTAIATWLADTSPYDDAAFNGGPDRFAVFASNYDGSAWSPATIVGRADLVDEDNTLEMDFDINSTGSGVIAWTVRLPSANNPTTYEVGASRFDATLGQWSSPEVLDTSDRPQIHSRTGIDDIGNALAAWKPDQNPMVTAIEYDASTATWGDTATYTDTPVTIPNHYDVAVTADGDTLLSWTADSDPNGLLFRRRSAGTTEFGDIIQLGSYGGTSGAPTMRTSPNGNIIIVSQMTVAGYRSIFATVFRTPL